MRLTAAGIPVVQGGEGVKDFKRYARILPNLLEKGDL